MVEVSSLTFQIYVDNPQRDMGQGVDLIHRYF
jgi:hypothetical protein